MDVYQIPVIIRSVYKNKTIEEIQLDNINKALEWFESNFPNSKKAIYTNIIMIRVNIDLVLDRLGGSVHWFMTDKIGKHYYLDFKNRY